jgi:hypothetical protein
LEFQKYMTYLRKRLGGDPSAFRAAAEIFPIRQLFQGVCSCEATPAASDPAQAALDARQLYRWSQRWTETLTRLRGAFDGDLDQYLLLLVFMQAEMSRTLGMLESAARNVSAFHEPRGMNAMSLAEICGIPRETARRKLRRLIERDFVVVGPDGLYYLAKPFSVDDLLEDIGPLYQPVSRQPAETE